MLGNTSQKPNPLLGLKHSARYDIIGLPLVAQTLQRFQKAWQDTPSPLIDRTFVLASILSRVNPIPYTKGKDTYGIVRFYSFQGARFRLALAVSMTKV
jgi:hypothetical protein